MREDRQSQWKIFDECLWAQEGNHSHNDKKRHLDLALCWLPLWYSTPYCDAQHALAQANNSNAATEGALEKNRVIQTTEICTDFWEDFYFDKKKSAAKAYHYFFNLAMIYDGFLPMAIWRQSCTWFFSQTIQKAGFVFWQFWRKMCFFLKCTPLKRATDCLKTDCVKIIVILKMESLNFFSLS